jgi:hypothetical protein
MSAAGARFIIPGDFRKLRKVLFIRYGSGVAIFLVVALVTAMLFPWAGVDLGGLRVGDRQNKGESNG